VRYSSPEAEVKVLYQWDKQALSVSIIDQGPGIPADQRDRVFDRFYRDINAEGNGSGLGLAIARQIASLHGAEIALALTETGQGLSVTVNFDSKQLNPAGAWKI
jgi:K+-sensing histidine kinase KdpD